MKDNPIVIVEDDIDDCEFLVHALKDIGVKNEFKCFHTPIDALEYLQSTEMRIFLIISDVNMPVMNGLDLKRCINEDKHLYEKSIPFVFLSTSGERTHINEAFRLCVQGYFQKPSDMASLHKVAKSIIDYWSISKQPQLAN